MHPRLETARRRLEAMQLVDDLPTISIIGPLDNSAEHRIRGRIERLARLPIGGAVLQLNSPGGSVEVADRIGADLVALRRPIGAHVASQTASAAARLLAVADHRTIAPGAFVALHRAEILPQQRWTADQHRRAAAYLEQSDSDTAALLARQLGLNPWAVDQMLSGEFRISAWEARNMGLVHRIVPDGSAMAWHRAAVHRHG